MTLLFGPDSERTAAAVDAELALRAPVGALSPLWFYFTGAASAGVAFWWLSRWTGLVNLEAEMAERAVAAPMRLPAPVLVASIAAPPGPAILEEADEKPPAPARPRKPKAET